MKVRVWQGNPDNLDAVFEAYHTLKAVFEAAEAVEMPVG